MVVVSVICLPRLDRTRTGRTLPLVRLWNLGHSGPAVRAAAAHRAGMRRMSALCTCPTCVPLDAIPDGWRFISCLRAASDDGEWYVLLEGPEKPWPIRTASA